MKNTASFGGILALLLIFSMAAAGCKNGASPTEEGSVPPPPEGSLPIFIGFFTGGSVAIEGDDGVNKIYKAGTPNSLTLTSSGYETVKWYVDAETSPTAEANSITISAADYDAGVHAVSFTGFAGGDFFSSVITFSVYP
jgi:hypothetical protein